MAEPLTSSDIIREQMGFGPTSPDEKRRAAGAGISPLGTMERIRFEEGRGLSPLASKSEKEAYMASEVMAGRRDPMELPKSYGGLGERPEASTRRQFRRQQEWDKQYAVVRAEEEAARQIEESDRDYVMRQQDQQNKMEEERGKRDAELARVGRESEIRNQSRKIREAFIGATLPDGSKTRPIDLNSDDAVERIQSTVYMNDLGMEDQATKEMASMFLDDALRFREKKANEISERAKVDTQTITDLTKLAKLTERNTSDLFSIDPETKDVVVNPTAVGEAQADLALREKRGEVKDPSYSDLNKDAGVLRGKIRDINLDIIVENNLYNKAKTDREKSLAQSRIEQLEAQRDFLSTEYLGLQSVLDQRSVGGGAGQAQPETLKFATPEEAEAAGLRAGTIVEIGGRRARID
jgi:hypothetical protein